MIGYMLIFGWITAGFKSSLGLETVTMVDVDSNTQTDKLSCWTCLHTELKPNPNCVYMMNKTLIMKTTCGVHEPYCKIKKRTSNSHVEWFERSCAEHCDPSCQQLKPLRQCYWCCTQSECNSGSHGNKLQIQSSLVILINVFNFVLYFK